MRLRCLLASFFSIASLLGNAQDSLQWSPSFRVARNIEDFGVVKATDEYLFTYELSSGKTEELTLTCFAFGKKEVLWKHTYPLPQPENCPQDFRGIYAVGDRFLLFTSGTNKSASRVEAYVMEIGLFGDVLKESRLIHEKIWSSESAASNLLVDVSPNKKQVLLYFDATFERKLKEPFSFRCYTAKMELLWQKELELPAAKDVIHVHRCKVDDLGRIYLMSGEEKQQNGHASLRAQNGRYVVFYYNALDNVLKEYDVSLEEKQVTAIHYALDTTNRLHIAGLYSSTVNGSAVGTFYFRLKEHAEDFEAAAYMAFPSELLDRFLSVREKEKKQGIDDLFLDHIALGEDGRIHLLCEIYYVTERLMSDISTGRQFIEYNYHYGHNIVLQLGQDGRIAHSHVISKHQIRVNSSTHFSYTWGYRNGELHFFFNDQRENAERLAKKSDATVAGWMGTQNSVITHVTINQEGQMVRKTLIDNRTTDDLLSPELLHYEQGWPLLIGNSSGKTVRFARVL
jgi:hypothetical protein